MTPYAVIRLLKRIGFEDIRKNIHHRYSFPSYGYSSKNVHYIFQSSLKGEWLLTKITPDYNSDIKMDEIVDFINMEFGAEYLRDYNIEKILL